MVKKVLKMEKKPKICPICKKPFIPSRPDKIYCSVNCRMLKWYYANKQKSHNYYLKRRINLKNQLNSQMSQICEVCGGKRFVYHEKHGKRHACSLKYVINHKNDFIPLCRKCHYVLHYCLSRIPNFDINQFVKAFKKCQSLQK
jgi:hypothetical protein